MLERITFLSAAPLQREKNHYFQLGQQVPSHFLEAWKARGCTLGLSHGLSVSGLNGQVVLIASALLVR